MSSSAGIIIIGDEILSGRTQDKNIAFLSNWLNMNCGIVVSEVRIIPDVEKIIVKNIRLLSKEFNYVFTTGGIGPTLRGAAWATQVGLYVRRALPTLPPGQPLRSNP